MFSSSNFLPLLVLWESAIKFRGLCFLPRQGKEASQFGMNPVNLFCKTAKIVIP